MEVVNVSYLGSDGQYQTYAPSDIALINTSLITANFGTANDYIEYFIKDQNGLVLSSNYYVTGYDVGNNVNSITDTTSILQLNPEADVRASGYNRGVVNIKYNFLTKWLLSAPDPTSNFWIKEISTSRTEIKVARQDLSNTQLANAFGTFNTALAADAYYPDFYLNFGTDILVIAVNAVYVEENGNGYIIFKLYEPLPDQFDLKSTFWVVTDAANPAEFNVSINVTPDAIPDSTQLQGPNFKITLKDKIGQTTPYYNTTSLLSTSVSSSYQQLQSMMQENGIDINVDYSDFSNFVHFSSATNRLYNFNYKIQLIESASAGIAAGQTTTGAALLQQQIDSTITNFDGYEYYLYFNSASTAWPKQNGSIPYVLYSATSSQVANWLGSIQITPNGPATMSMYYSSSRYDDLNQDLLLYTAPSYIVEDPANQPYFLFLNMVGQMFDNIWIYLKDVTNLYAANNNPFKGISLEEVADAIRNTGVQLYTNTSISDNIYYSLLGINQTGSALPPTSSQYSTIVYSSSSLYPLAGEPYLTASLSLPPFGSELINRFVTTFITGSANVTSSFATLPDSQITAEIYKRIYHNMPYLLKTRGTRRGVQALITCFGVPEDILTVHEYGGYNIYNVAGIQAISDTKILTGSVLNISSSLLSPYTTIQYYQNDQDKSSGDLEIGFSPADSINASITSSGYVTSSTQPGYFNIMQQIGAPNLQYSSSYIPLVELANTYFDAEYTSGYNVWDFIRIIKYYNNSLFKMLRDWVPARTSTSTGIVVQSHLLERNKYPRHEPTYTVLSGSAQIKLVSVSGSDGGAIQGNTYYVEAIPVQYQSNSVDLGNSPGTIYMSSSNNIQKYTGEFSGSTIDTYSNTFTQEEISSYAYPWTSSVAPSTVGGNIIYSTYSLSPTLNNITGAVLSQRFLDLDYNGAQLIPVNYGLITQSIDRTLVIGNLSQSIQPYSQYAQLQDYNYFLPSTVSIRYSGSYLQGAQYNTWSVGDISYGNQPVINYYSDKLGLFTQIQSSSFIPGTVNASLGYLADVSGGLFELNQNNKHWVDIQNIFVQGTQLTVKQFDNKKYSNQVATDGIKTIYNSGYNYTPQLYFMSGANADQKVYFEFLGTSTQDSGFSAVNSLTPNAYVSGNLGGNDYYPVTLTDPANRVGSIFRIFNTNNNPANTNYTAGTSTTTPYYTPTAIETLTFNANFDINLAFTADNQIGEYIFRIMNGATEVASQVRDFTSNVTSGGDPSGVGTTNGPGILTGPIGSDSITLTGPLTVYIQSTVATITYAFGQYILNYTTPGFPVPYPIALGETVVLRKYQPTYLGNLVGPTSWAVYSDGTAGNEFAAFTQANNGWFQTFTEGTPPANNYSTTLNFNLTTAPTQFTPSDTISFQLTQSIMTTENFTASLSAGSLTGTVATQGAGNYPYATASIAKNPNGWYIDSIADSTVINDASTITFTADISQFWQYQQVPYFVTASGGLQVIVSSSLYDSPVGSGSYKDINSPFNPQFGDKIVMSDYGGTIQVLDVYSASFNSGTKKLETIVSPEVKTSWQTTPSSIYKFLLLRRYNDEQNVILTFNKNSGATSYGFIIPDTINPAVPANINTLQANVQAQLLSTQVATGNP